MLLCVLSSSFFLLHWQNRIPRHRSVSRFQKDFQFLLLKKTYPHNFSRACDTFKVDQVGSGSKEGWESYRVPWMAQDFSLQMASCRSSTPIFGLITVVFYLFLEKHTGAVLLFGWVFITFGLSKIGFTRLCLIFCFCFSSRVGFCCGLCQFLVLFWFRGLCFASLASINFWLLYMLDIFCTMWPPIWLIAPTTVSS